MTQEDLENSVSSIIEEPYESNPLFKRENGGFRLSEELVVAQNPEKYLLSDRDGEYMGLNVYTDGPHSELPPERKYISGSHPGEVATKEELCRVLRSKNSSPMLIGDAGTAKNTSIYCIYSKLGQPVYREQMSNGYTVHDIVSSTQLRDGNTITELKSIGLAAVFGGVAVIDEINLATERLIGHLNSIVEKNGNRRVSLPGTGVTLSDLPKNEDWNPEEHLGRYIHPEFRVIATRNPPSYTGADMINYALTDRFSPIRYEYPSLDDEASLISEDTGVSKDAVKPLLEVINQEIRRPRENNEGPMCPISYRRICDTVEYAKCHGTTLYDAARTKIVGYAQSQADRHYIEGAIEDNQLKLKRGVLDSNKTYNCTECNSSLNYNMICEGCGRPSYESDMWHTKHRSEYISSFALSEDDSLLASIFTSDSETITYKYPNASEDEYQSMCEATNLESVYSREVKGNNNLSKVVTLPEKPAQAQKNYLSSNERTKIATHEATTLPPTIPPTTSK